MPHGRARSHRHAYALLLACACTSAAGKPEMPHAPPVASAPAPGTAKSAEEREPTDALEGIAPEPADESASPEPTSPEPDPASAKEHDFQRPLPPRELARDAPAVRAANLSPSACLAEVRKRKLAVERDRGASPGVAAPVRITGPLRGVRFVAPGRRSVYGKLDCRLVLVLDELASVLERHGVVALRADNMYRPKARLPGRRKSSQHRYGLAIDVTAFELADGTTLSVETEWHGEIGSEPCGPGALMHEPSRSSIALRDLVCEIARSGLFHHILTPSYNEAHRDHVHFDIKRGEKRWIVE